MTSESQHLRRSRSVRVQPGPALALGLALLGCLTSGCEIFRPNIKQRRTNAQRVIPELPVALPYMVEPAPPFEEDEGTLLEASASLPFAGPIGDDQLHRIAFRGASLAQVVFALAETAGISMYLDPSLDQAVDLTIHDVTVDEAMRLVLHRNGLVLLEDPPGIYWVETMDGSEESVGAFRVRSIQAADVQPLLLDLVGDDTSVVVDANQNLVFVRGPQRDIDLVGSFLESADRLKKQVLIEVRIVEIVLDEQFEMGVAHRLGNVDIGDLGVAINQQLAGGGDISMVLDWNQGDLVTTLEALNQLTGVELVSSPRILAVTNTRASINVIRQIPFINVTSTQSGTTQGTGTQVVQEVQFEEAGITMGVTPSIQEGGVLRIQIEQTLSEVVDVFNSIPVIDRREMNQEFLVADRETIVLGGLMQTRTAEFEDGMPGLMELPIIGKLFQRDTDRTEKRELLVFLTPRIVDPHAADRLVDVYRGEYSERIRETGVRSAQDDENQ